MRGSGTKRWRLDRYCDAFYVNGVPFQTTLKYTNFDYFEYKNDKNEKGETITRGTPLEIYSEVEADLVLVIFAGLFIGFSAGSGTT